MKTNIPDKKTVVVLLSHNQKKTIARCIGKLRGCNPPPSSFIVVDDHSEPDQVPHSADPDVLVVHTGEARGRSSARNLGIREALAAGADYIIFMDGDTMPEDATFVEGHMVFLAGGDPGRMLFSTRRHIPNPEKPCSKPPSDYLTANMDSMYNGEELTSTDLRVVSDTVSTYQSMSSFDEKCDLILSGMVTWSCNFSFDREAANKLNALMQEKYRLDGWFDDRAFSSGWGYEDIAMGLDSLFAGIDVQIQDGPRVLHLMHDRTDDLHSHIQGRHRIMERYRRLLASSLSSKAGIGSHARSLYMAGGMVAYTDRSRIYLNGRVFLAPVNTLTEENHVILSVGKRIFVDGWDLDTTTGTYKRSLLGMLLNLLTSRS